MTENEILRRVARDYNLLCGLTPAVAEWVGLLLFSPTPHEWNVRHNPALLLISPNPSHMRYRYLLVRGAGFETFDGTGKGGGGSTALLPSAPASRIEKKVPSSNGTLSIYHRAILFTKDFVTIILSV